MATVHGENLRVYTRALYRLCWMAGFIVAITSATACGDACHDLASAICKCGRTESEQSSCNQRVDADTSVGTITDEQKQVCEQKLETCTCEALSNGDLAACGLANDES